MDEIPLTQRAFLALDDQQRLAADNEEVLLIGLPVVHRHRFPRAEHEEVDSELIELRFSLEHAHDAARAAIEPARIAGIEDEPAVTGRNEPVFRLLEPPFGCHRSVD